MKFAFQMQFNSEDETNSATAEMLQIIGEKGLIVVGKLYATITAEPSDPIAFWNDIKPKLKPFAKLIVICEGEQSWDDYRLLHHFNEQEVLDTL